MNIKQKAIKDYISKITKGVVVLKEEHVNRILEIAKEHEEIEDWKAILSKRLYVGTGGYEVMRTVKVSREKVTKVLQKHGDKDKAVHGFYKWEIHNREGILIHTIHSVNSHLF